jgi:hypothetical protein
VDHATHGHTLEVSDSPGRIRRLLLLLAGIAFVLVPNSEAAHAALRATLGVGGAECC